MLFLIRWPEERQFYVLTADSLDSLLDRADSIGDVSVAEFKQIEDLCVGFCLARHEEDGEVFDEVSGGVDENNWGTPLSVYWEEPGWYSYDMLQLAFGDDSDIPRV